MGLRVELLQGARIAAHLKALAKLRITVFREFPYLYEGSHEYEAQYLQTYIRCTDSLIVMAYDAEQAVGASTCLPLAQASAEMQQPFIDSGLPLDDTDYFGESVLLRPWRGRGLGVRFFEERERHGRGLGMRWAAFCAVDRPADHPLRPSDYVPHDAFWARRGYRQEPQLQCRLSWPDIGKAAASEKSMTFWRKPLEIS